MYVQAFDQFDLDFLPFNFSIAFLFLNRLDLDQEINVQMLADALTCSLRTSACPLLVGSTQA